VAKRNKDGQKDEQYKANPRSGGNMGAGKSGREDLGTETTHEEQGSHKPGEAPSRDAAIDHAEQDKSQRR
jgi:hypothetical protein